MERKLITKRELEIKTKLAQTEKVARNLHLALKDMVKYLDHNDKETDVSEFARDALRKADEHFGNFKCHCGSELGLKPSDCVFDTDDLVDCVYVRDEKYKSKEECPHYDCPHYDCPHYDWLYGYCGDYRRIVRYKANKRSNRTTEEGSRG